MNTLKLGLSTIEIDANDNQICSANYDLLFDYNEVFKNTIILPVDATAYSDISFANITSPFLAILSSENEINYKINGTERTGSLRTVINTPITSLSVFNPNEQETAVNVIIYGVSDV